MVGNQSVDLNKDQLEMVLRGLRFVRSSISMELYDPTPELTAKRSQQLREVENLVRHLGGAGANRATAGV